MATLTHKPTIMHQFTHSDCIGLFTPSLFMILDRSTVLRRERNTWCRRSKRGIAIPGLAEILTPRPSNYHTPPFYFPPPIMDPLSVAASVTGLIIAGGQIASLIQRLYDAPSIALAVETETSHFVVVLSQLQPFLTGQRNTIAHPSRASLVEVQQIQIILSGSVLTLSELQAAVGAICHGSTIISLRDRMKWMMAESNIAALIQRVRDHKSSLTLLLTLLTWYNPVSPPPHLSNADVPIANQPPRRRTT